MTVIFDDTAASSVVDGDVDCVSVGVQGVLDQLHDDPVEMRDGDGGFDLGRHVRGEGLDGRILRRHGRTLAVLVISHSGISKSHMVLSSVYGQAATPSWQADLQDLEVRAWRNQMSLTAGTRRRCRCLPMIEGILRWREIGGPSQRRSRGDHDACLDVEMIARDKPHSQSEGTCAIDSAVPVTTGTTLLETANGTAAPGLRSRC